MATDKAKFIQSEKVFHVQNGEINEVSSLGSGVVAALKANDNFEALNINETLDTTQYMSTDPFNNGWTWYADGYAETSANLGGSGNWLTYQQENILTRARRHAGKTNRYGLSLYRPPNVEPTGCCTTWGGLVMYPPAQAKLAGHTYRLSFNYRGYTNTFMEIIHCYTVGWCNLGFGLPLPVYTSVAAFDTDWEWRRYEVEWTVTQENLDWTPGQNGTIWDPGVQYGDWALVTYEGNVYRKPSWTGTPTQGVPPDQEYPAIWDARVPAQSGYFDLYREIKIGVNYSQQNDRGTHFFIDNVHIEDVTDNKGFKYNNTTFEANNFREETIQIFAKGTAYPTLGDPDRFRVEGPRVLTVNGTNIYTQSGGRGLRLTVFEESSPTSPIHDQVYDTYGVDFERTDLANQLSLINDNQIWVLTSFDAIISNDILDGQMRAMGSEIGWQNGTQWSVYGSGARATYVAVGRGQRIIKEDGSAASEPIFKRKGVIDLWI